MARRHKYNARKTIIDGIRFDSKREGKRYQDLKLLERAGEISNLKLQPRFRLQEPFACMGKRYREIDYIADFEYLENGKRIIEDVKGVKTNVFRIKEKLFVKRYGDKVEFRIVE